MSTIAELFAQALRSHQGGDLRQAEPLYRQILQAEPLHADAHHLLGLVAYQTGDHQTAIELIGRAIALSPSAAVYHSNLGLAFMARGQLHEAIACYRRALQLSPRFADALSHLGNALKDAGQLDEAIACCREALRLNPNHANALNNLGIALQDQKRLDEAIECYREALRVNPQFPDALSNLGLVLRDQGHYEEAVEHFRRALHFNPDLAQAHNNLGIALKDQGKVEEAAASFEQARRLKPDYHSACWNRALLRLLQGDFTGAWSDFECRWELSGFVKSHEDQPRWDGAPLQGRTILLYAEQGLGDTIQFIRYAPLVKKRGGTVVFECPPVLVELLSGIAGVDRLVPVGSPLPFFHVRLPLLSLPGLFDTTLATIPAQVPYLEADPEKVKHWRQDLEPQGGFQVGIVWQGSPTHANDRARSIPLDLFEPLARVEGVRLVSLQVGPGTEQLAEAGKRFGVIDLGSRFDRNSLADVAAAMQGLDLVVTVDTAIAHLAGALEVPVWTLLPFVPDWRWLLERPDSPWYPTMRLFRQERPGDWESVIGRVAAVLGKQMAAARRGRPILVEMAPGDLIDKITILEIESQWIVDEAKLRPIRAELKMLQSVLARTFPANEELERLTAELKEVNQALWRIEDSMREHEKHQDFGSTFIELARSVVRTKDRRTALKRQINDLVGSRPAEQSEPEA